MAREAIEFRGSRVPTVKEMAEWIGWRVSDAQGSMIGRLKGVDPGGPGEEPYLLIDESRFGGRRYYVPGRQAAGSGDLVWLPYEREWVGATSDMVGRFDSLGVDARKALAAHYGLDRRSRRSRRKLSRDAQDPAVAVSAVGRGLLAPDGSRPAAVSFKTVSGLRRAS